MMNQELLYKYFKGTASIEEEKQILDWVEASEENREAYLKERMLFDVSLFSTKQDNKKKQYDSCQRSVGRRVLQRQSSLPYPVTT